MDIAQGNAVDLLKNISIPAVTTYRSPVTKELLVSA